MMWPWGHQCSQKGWSASETSTSRKPCARSPGFEPRRWTCSSFRRSRSKAIEPFEPLISQVNAFLRPGQKRDASIVPIAPFSNSTAASNASSTSRPALNVLVDALTDCDLAHQVAREVDHVRAEVAERARAGGRALEPPDLVVDVAPLLQVAAAEVVDVAQIARLDHLAREPHGRHEAVVEGAHVLDACGCHPLPDVVALVGRARRAASRR